MNLNYIFSRNILTLLLLFLITVFSSISQNRAVLNVLDKTNGKARVEFIQESKIKTNCWYHRDILGLKKVITDSTYNVVFEPLKTNKFITCSWLYDNKPILMTPGDSLNVVIDYSEDDKNFFNVIFKGKNDINYNFNTLRLQGQIRNKTFSRIKTAKNIKECLQFIDSTYASNISILKKTPFSIYSQVKINEEKANYFRNLFLAVDFLNVTPKHTEILKLKDRIFSKKIACPLPCLMNYQNYTAGIYQLNQLLCRNIKSDNKLMCSTDTIKKYFIGELRNYLLACNFYNIYSTNQKQNKKNLYMDQWFNLYDNKLQDPEYNNYISFTYDKYKKLNAPLPEDVFREKIISLNDSTEFTIGDLVNRYKGKFIIVDHWATWCGSCIQEIKVGEKQTKKLEEKGIEFIYVSLDNMNNFNKAKQKAIELKINEKAYILPRNFETKYAKYLKISEIPRYLLIDDSGNIINLDLTRPSQISDTDNLTRYNK